MIWPHPDILYGLKIIKAKEFLQRKRTWLKRLFSWPWRPWVKTEIYLNPALPEKGKIYKMGDTLVMRESDATELLKQLQDSSN